MRLSNSIGQLQQALKPDKAKESLLISLRKLGAFPWQDQAAYGW